MPSTKHAYLRAMELLQALCMGFAALAIIGMTLIIAWSVYTRYWLNLGSFWAEPIAIMLAVQMTFFGAAACYRVGGHISIDVVTRLLPDNGMHRAAERLVDLLVMVLGLAMIWYGTGLVRTTWFQVYPEFQQIRVGLVYTAVPLSGLVTLLFAGERLVFGAPPSAGEAV
ncbi:MAG: TRAP transporter small permease [Geminicoccaceae bacterium]|jgi:TRAP-type C4-dicarboxylate transport system permease small subunit|nr:TRAP transporter small permease [Geminicoccaceae bacterium]